MIKLLKITFSIFLAFFIFPIVSTNATLKNNIIVKVGNEIITSFELENKIKSTLLLTKQQLTQENINKVKSLSLKSLVNLKLKQDEIKRYNFKSNQNALDQHLIRVSQNLGVEITQLRDLFENNKINYDQYLNEINTEFLWQKMIYTIYVNEIRVDEKQIENEINNLINLDKDIEEFRLAEIEIDLINNSEKEKLTNQIKSYIDEFGFSNTASNYSTSSTALNGGELGWISSSGISNKILNVIKMLKVGEVSQPIVVTNKLVFFKLLDKRLVANNNEINIPDLKESLINKKKTELLNLYSNNHLSKKRNATLINIK